MASKYVDTTRTLLHSIPNRRLYYPCSRNERDRIFAVVLNEPNFVDEAGVLFHHDG